MVTLPRDPAKWPVEWRTEMQEREAIMIVDGGVDERTARAAAVEEIRRRADGERLW